MDPEFWKTKLADQKSLAGTALVVLHDDEELYRITADAPIPYPAVGEQLQLFEERLVRDDGAVEWADETPPEDAPVYTVIGVNHQYVTVDVDEKLRGDYHGGYTHRVSVKVAEGPATEHGFGPE